MDDGRYNNNGWLQELPDPITKMTWENVILMSVKTAKELGVYRREQGEQPHPVLPWSKIELDGRTVEGPVWAQPGQADNTIGLAWVMAGRRPAAWARIPVTTPTSCAPRRPRILRVGAKVDRHRRAAIPFRHPGPRRDGRPPDHSRSTSGGISRKHPKFRQSLRHGKAAGGRRPALSQSLRHGQGDGPCINGACPLI